jgi:hypothetical protein
VDDPLEKLTKEQVQTASSAVRELRVSLSNYFLYSSENPMVLEALGRFSKSLESLFENLPSVSLGESEGRMVVEGSLLDERLTGSTNMIKDIFLTHKIHSLTFTKGIQPLELRTLFGLLRPRALPSGTTLFQALAQQPLEHIQLNEKVFVAIKEGEKIVSAEEAGFSDEENLQEAMGALQYFLQIFSRVRPDSNKREVAMRLTEHMGSWLKDENLIQQPGSSGSGKGGGSGSSENAKPLMELLSGFWALKKSLESIREPSQLGDMQVNMDELLRKLVVLGENHGLRMEERDGEATVVDTWAEQQEALFEVDPVMNAMDSGKVEIFWDPAFEDPAAKKLPQVQNPEKIDLFESLWEGLWRQIMTGEEKVQAVSLRQLNRLQWNEIPRPLQLEGFRNLRRFLAEPRHTANFPLGMALVQNWLPMELTLPNQEELIEMVLLIKQLSEMSPPLFDKQNLLARVALESVFSQQELEALYSKCSPENGEKNNYLKLFSILAPWVGPFLWEKTEKAPVDSAEWNKAVEMLEALETMGAGVLEGLLREKVSQEQMGKWALIFKKILPPESFCAHCEKNWHSFAPELQEKLMEMMETFPRKSFRPLLVGLLEVPDQPMALRALALLPDVGRQGDARDIISAMKKYKPHSAGWDQFTIKACHILGKMTDPYSINFLFELAEHYKFLEGHKDRPLEFRRAAIEALGNYHSQSVKNYLTALQKGLEKELKPGLEQSLKSVEENLRKWHESQQTEGMSPTA